VLRLLPAYCHTYIFFHYFNIFYTTFSWPIHQSGYVQLLSRATSWRAPSTCQPVMSWLWPLPQPLN
jgi:hypothetical protein